MWVLPLDMDGSRSGNDDEVVADALKEVNLRLGRGVNQIDK